MRIFAHAQYRQEASSRTRVLVTPPPVAQESTHPVVDLQHTLGNRAVLRILQRGSNQSVIRRAIDFNDHPTPTRQDPIPRVLRSRTIDLGLTTPTINGVQLPTGDRDAAVRIVGDALSPKQIHLRAVSGGSGSASGSGSGSASPVLESQFSDFPVRISANVNLPTKPQGKKWGSEYIEIRSFGAPKACQGKDSVPVTMVGDPDTPTIEALIAHNEQEHVNDLRDAVNAHLAPAYTWLMSLRGRGASEQEAQDDLNRQVTDGLRRFRGMIDAFLDAVAAAVAGRDRGSHSVCGSTRIIGQCDRLEISVKKGACP